MLLDDDCESTDHGCSWLGALLAIASPSPVKSEIAVAGAVQDSHLYEREICAVQRFPTLWRFLMSNFCLFNAEADVPPALRRLSPPVGTRGSRPSDIIVVSLGSHYIA